MFTLRITYTSINKWTLCISPYSFISNDKLLQNVLIWYICVIISMQTSTFVLLESSYLFYAASVLLFFCYNLFPGLYYSESVSTYYPCGRSFTTNESCGSNSIWFKNLILFLIILPNKSSLLFQASIQEPNNKSSPFYMSSHSKQLFCFFPDNSMHPV
jgi:hypothetical protein